MDADAATSGPAMSPVHAPDIEARPTHATTIEAGRSMAVFRRDARNTVCPVQVTTMSRRSAEIDLEVPGPHLPRPSVHLDPEEAGTGAGLEGDGILSDDLVPAVGPEGRVVVGHPRKQASPTDSYSNRAR